jgi:hypothetical protein
MKKERPVTRATLGAISNRRIGASIVEALLEAGASRGYAAMCSPGEQGSDASILVDDTLAERFGTGR